MESPFRLLILMVIVFCFQFSRGDDSIRLSSTVQPNHYDLYLNVSLDEPNDISKDFSFNGKVSISVDLNDSISDKIRLHSKKLAIADVYLDNEASNISFDLEKDFLIIQLDGSLPAGSHLINITFSGNFSDDNKGIYRTNYEENGLNISGAATQLAPINARKLFPCFDEPQMRAEFDLTVEHSINKRSFSNMPIVQTSKVSDVRNLSTFHSTKFPIAPFLFNFALNNYEELRDKKYYIYFSSKYNTHDIVNKSLQLSIQLEHVMDGFVGTGYPSFILNQMGDEELKINGESTIGFLHYNTKYLYFDPTTETSEKVVQIMKVMSHKISNTWFGNVITPFWWQYIWLSEGFGTFFEYFLPSKLSSTSVSMDSFVVNVQQEIMIEDTLKSSHPVEIEVDDPTNWSPDDIILKKGGAIIRMFQHILTPSVFHLGVQKYIKDMYLKSAQTEDLWRNFQSASESLNLSYSISEIGNSWVLQSGYPVVFASITQLESSPALFLNQTKFLSSDIDAEWFIPITFTTKSSSQFDDTFPKYWLVNSTLEIPLMESAYSNGDWVIVNFEQTGFYRVNYDLEIWQSLTKYLIDDNENTIPDATRAQLLDDAFTLAENDYLDLSVALDLSKFLKFEKALSVWESAIRHFNLLEKHLSFSTVYGEWKDFIVQLTSTAYNSIAFNPNDKSQSLINSLLILKVGSLACIAGNTNCQSIALNIYQSEDLSPDYQSAIYCTSIKYGSSEQWNYFYNEYQKPTVSNFEKDRILLGLGCTENITTINEYLQSLLDPQSVIKNVDHAVMAIYMNNPEGVETVLSFIKDNANQFSNEDLVSILNGLATRLVTTNQQNDFDTIVATLSSDMQNKLTSAQNEVTDNVMWHTKHIADLESWFKQFDPTVMTLMTMSTISSATEPISTSTVTESTAITTPTVSSSTAGSTTESITPSTEGPTTEASTDKPQPSKGGNVIPNKMFTIVMVLFIILPLIKF